MSYLSNISWLTVSSLDTFCDEKKVQGFNSVLNQCYDSSVDGWPDHSPQQLQKAHKQLTKILYQADYSYDDVEEYEI